MRDIKFRAWHKTLNKILNVYIISQQTDGMGVYTYKCQGWYGNNNQVVFAYDQVIWMQYTGLKDKQGREIYEDDIILIKEFIDRGDGVYDDDLAKICFYDGCFVCDTKIETGFKEYLYVVSSVYEVEIIGNIYENPELLK